MKDLIKRAGITILISIIIAGIFGLFIAIFGFTTPIKSVATFHNSDLNIIDNTIAFYTKQGYSVKFTEAQSVSTSVAANWEYGYPTSKRDIKGELFIIMEK